VPDGLDLIVAALCTVFAMFGYRQGLAAGILSLAGFVDGAAAGDRVAASLSGAIAPAGPSRVFVAILTGFAAAVLGSALMSPLARLLRRLSGRPAGRVDSVGGAALNVLFVLAVALVVTSFAVDGSPGFVSRQVHDSLVVRILGRAVPDSWSDSMQVSAAWRLEDALGLNPADLPAPSAGVLNSPGAAAARRSVVLVEGHRSCSSGLDSVDGSGVVVGPEHVLTNAHVVAGLTRPPVISLAGGHKYHARVVLYDPRRDVAVLYVPGLRATAAHFIARAPLDASAIVAGFPGGGQLMLVPATVGASSQDAISGISASTAAYLDAYAVRAQIMAGNSGGPLLAPSGGVYGIVFAKSTTAQQAGWAITTSEFASDVSAGTPLTTSVPTPAQLAC
jgi:S1-C subfamily serine protease